MVEGVGVGGDTGRDEREVATSGLGYGRPGGGLPAGHRHPLPRPGPKVQTGSDRVVSERGTAVDGGGRVLPGRIVDRRPRHSVEWEGVPDPSDRNRGGLTVRVA